MDSTILPPYTESGEVDQEWIPEYHHEEKRDILVTWLLDLSQSLSGRKGKLAFIPWRGYQADMLETSCRTW